VEGIFLLFKNTEFGGNLVLLFVQVLDEEFDNVPDVEHSIEGGHRSSLVAHRATTESIGNQELEGFNGIGGIPYLFALQLLV